MNDIDPVGGDSGRGSWLTVVVAWALVGLPLGWGIYKTLEKALILFR